MTDARVLLCTAPPDQAESVARALLERHLVACVNIVPGARSLYWWQGKLEDERESLLILKTTADRLVGKVERTMAPDSGSSNPSMRVMPSGWSVSFR